YTTLFRSALGVAGDPFQMLFERRIVIDFEMVRGVDVPLELVVVGVVLAEIRDHRGLSPSRHRLAAEPEGSESSDQASGQHAGAHRRYLERATTVRESGGDLTVDGEAPANAVLATRGAGRSRLSSGGPVQRPL